MSIDKASRAPRLSNRSEAGATVSNGASVAIAEVVALQTGQKCEEAGAAVELAQKWNCAPRKKTARSSAKTAIPDERWCMCFVRRSLGKIGCGVKHSHSTFGATKRCPCPSKLLH